MGVYMSYTGPGLESLKDVQGICFMSMKTVHLQKAQIKILSAETNYHKNTVYNVWLYISEKNSCMNQCGWMNSFTKNCEAATAVDSRCA